jgi:NAD(P)-dependent dehydrogenase (short-subunit alcohol dehydrogenase family)
MRTLEVFERLDGAFNNAGIPGPVGTFADVPAEEYRKLMTINLDSVMLCMQHQIRAMRRGGGGAIVNCASILGMVGAASFGTYSTAKHGLVGLTRAAALDHAAEGIRVNAVLPGPVETELWEHMDQGEAVFGAFTQGVPMQRYARSEEVARPVVFLLSDWASYVTGTHLAIDGGYLSR